MGKNYLTLLIVALFVGGVYWYQSTAATCPAPLSYRIGEIDKSFGISNEEALEYTKEAESLWEDSVNRELFIYDETADLTIDFVFDERQESANMEASLSDDLDTRRKENETVLQTVESLQSDFQSLSEAYKTRSEDYETRLVKYNAEVNQYNDRGGAPPDVYKDLENERKALNSESQALATTAAELNQLAKKINELGERSNLLVESYNRDVSKYNTEFSFGHEFTQGDYQGKKIRIYKFSSDAELITVLAHEFGHTLSIGHVDGTSSVMYYLLEDTDKIPTLSSNDLAAYYAVCGTEETLDQTVRRIIREFLLKIKQ